MRPHAVLAALAVTLPALATVAPAEGDALHGEVHGAGWWAGVLTFEGDAGLAVDAHIAGVHDDPDHGAALIALVDAAGTLVGEYALVGEDEHLGATASAILLEPTSPDLPDLGGTGLTSVVFPFLLFPVPAGTYTLLLVAAAETGEVDAELVVLTANAQLHAETRGTDAYVLGERAFQCGLGASLAAPPVRTLPAARATAMSACHRQAQLHESLVTLYRVKPGAGTSPAYTVVDPVGNVHAPHNGRVLLVDGGAGVWEYTLDAHAGAGAGDGAPDVAALVADVVMPRVGGA